jgi:hypothetical protein
MNSTLIVQKFDGGDEFPHDAGCFGFSKLFCLTNACEQLGPLEQFQYQIDVELVTEHFDQLDNVAMVFANFQNLSLTIGLRGEPQGHNLDSEFSAVVFARASAAEFLISMRRNNQWYQRWAPGGYRGHRMYLAARG